MLASYSLPRLIASFASPIKIVRNILVTIVVLAGVTTLMTLFGLGATDTRAFAGSYLSWSYFLGVAILSGLVLLNISSNRLIRAFIVVLEPLFLAAMFLTMARGPLISLLVTGGLILLWKGYVSVRKKIGIVLSLLVVLAVLVSVLPPSFWSRYELLFAQDKGSSIDARLDAYDLAGQLFIEHPLLGAGTGSFRSASLSASLSRESPYALSYAHNAFLQIAAENGLLGLFFYMGFLTFLFLSARRTLKDVNTAKIARELTLGCLLVFIFLFIGTQFSGSIIGRDELLFAGLIVLLGTEAS